MVARSPDVTTRPRYMSGASTPGERGTGRGRTQVPARLSGAHPAPHRHGIAGRGIAAHHEALQLMRVEPRGRLDRLGGPPAKPALREPLVRDPRRLRVIS